MLSNTLTHPFFIGQPKHFLVENFNRFSRYILFSRVFYFSDNRTARQGIWARQLGVNFERAAGAEC